MDDIARDLLLERLFADTRRPVHPPVKILALVDTARSERAAEAIRACPLRHECLPRGVEDPELLFTLPWVVEIERDSAWLRELLDWAWGTATVSFVETLAPFERVLGHFRAALVIEKQPPEELRTLREAAEWADHHGQHALAHAIEDQVEALAPKSILRAWDPRVMRRLLAGESPVDPEHLAGPVMWFHFESEDGRALLSWTRLHDGFSCERTELERRAA
jgi:hypothetical protein